MAKFIECYRGYIIKLTNRGHIVIKGDKHSHIKRYEHCKLLIDILNKKDIPKKRYFIIAAMRLCEEGDDYYMRLGDYLQRYDGVQNCVKSRAGVDPARCGGRY